MPLVDDEVRTFIFNFVVAGVTASIAKTITAPIDRIKLILQNQSSALQILTKERKSYKGIIDCFIRLPKEQGFTSLWRGNVLNLIRYFPTQALNFSFNDYFKQHFYGAVGNDHPGKTFCVEFLSGSLAGGISTGLLYPLEFCQTKISVDIGTDKKLNKRVKAKKAPIVEREFSGLCDCILKVNKTEGPTGLYTGFIIAVAGVALYRGLYFSLFDLSKRLWAEEPIYSNSEIAKPPFLVGLMLAQFATCIAGAVSYPLDTVGRRLMMESGRPKELRMFDSSWTAFKVTYRKDGIKSFYKGILANCLRGFGGALVLVFYDETKHYAEKIKSTPS